MFIPPDPINDLDLDGQALPIVAALAAVAWTGLRVGAQAAVKYAARPAAHYATKKAAPFIARKAVQQMSRVKTIGTKAGNGVKKVVNYTKSIRFSLHKDTKYDHRFPRLGNKWYKHIQVDFYRKGVSNSHKNVIRIPYGKGCKLKYCANRR